MADDPALTANPLVVSDSEACQILNVDTAGLQALVDDGTLSPLWWQGTSTRCFDRGTVVIVAQPANLVKDGPTGA